MGLRDNLYMLTGEVEVDEAMKYLSPADAQIKNIFRRNVLGKLARSPFATNVYRRSEGSDFKLISTNSKMYPQNNRKHGLYFDPKQLLEVFDKSGNSLGKQTAALGFYHEVVHRFRDFRRQLRVLIRTMVHSQQWTDFEEKRVIQYFESEIARILPNEPIRNSHD